MVLPCPFTWSSSQHGSWLPQRDPPQRWRQVEGRPGGEIAWWVACLGHYIRSAHGTTGDFGRFGCCPARKPRAQSRIRPQRPLRLPCSREVTRGRMSGTQGLRTCTDFWEMGGGTGPAPPGTRGQTPKPWQVWHRVGSMRICVDIPCHLGDPLSVTPLKISGVTGGSLLRTGPAAC